MGLDYAEQPYDYDNEADNKEVIRLKISDVLNNLHQILQHLSDPRKEAIKGILQEFIELFPDVPGQTTAAVHDVDVGGAMLIKQHAYRVNSAKHECIHKEVKYMLQNGIVEPNQSRWSSPCVLVPNPDGSYRFYTDFQNVVTKPDCNPLPRIDDGIDQIGSAQFISKFDLLKGYWQVPLSEHAKEISALLPQGGYINIL